MDGENGQLKTFGKFSIDTRRKVLRHDGETVAMPLKQIELLCVLVENRGELVTKNELLDKLWADSFVEESNLSRHVYLLRKTLKDYGADGDLIENVARRGYRFTGEVRAGGGELIIEKYSLTRTLIEEFSEVAADGKNDALTDSALKNRAFPLRLIAATVFFCVLAITFGGWQYYGAKGDSETSSVLAANRAGFDDSEKILTDFGFAFEKAWAVAVQTDGKFVLGGWAGENLATADFAIARFNADGSLDTTFGDEGKVITNFGYGGDIAYSLVLQPDGKLVAAGVATNGMNQDFALARYNADGSLDKEFGAGGKVRTDFFDEDDLISAIALQPDGKILVAGYAVKATRWDFAAARYAPDGSLDNSFNGGGKLTTDIKINDLARAVALLPDGGIIVSGMSNYGTRDIGTAPEFALVRLLPDGNSDTTFNAESKISTQFQTYGEAGGDALIVGAAGDGKTSDFAFLRVKF